MKLSVRLEGKEHQVDFSRHGSRVEARIDDRLYDADVRELGDKQYLLLANGDVFNCRVARVGSEPFIVTVGTNTFEISVTDPKRLRGAAGAATPADKAARIVAPMPGKVVRVLVEVGEQVETGAGIIVVEAMKMQNEMKSPIAGTVVTLNAAVGATVNAGDVLAVIEELDH